jgi:hypothetical protein
MFSCQRPPPPPRAPGRNLAGVAGIEPAGRGFGVRTSTITSHLHALRGDRRESNPCRRGHSPPSVGLSSTATPQRTNFAGGRLRTCDLPLTRRAFSPAELHRHDWRGRAESNRRPLPYQRSGLPTDLHPHELALVAGVEPAISALRERRCSLLSHTSERTWRTRGDSNPRSPT